VVKEHCESTESESDQTTKISYLLLSSFFSWASSTSCESTVTVIAQNSSLYTRRVNGHVHI